MLKKVAFILCLFVSMQVFGWGMTGHRVVGYVAEQHLSKKAKKRITEILDGESLATVSNWMDDIKSDHAYDHTHNWHWVTIPNGKTYEETEKNPDGDVISTIERIITDLKKGGLPKEKEAEGIKMLAHLIGDIHQPLHVGTGEDMGGNQVKLKWFWESSNLHSVWDSGMIDSENYSYTELGDVVNHASKEEIKEWQSSSVRDWAYESMSLRNQVYNLPETKDINYEYRYKNWRTVKERLKRAGIRLAGVLNDIYG
ncbi:S1/P1 nuclease [Fulvivirga sediminis]|uniref:S1/P1 nuclease n=1 Tax=Fulvivirga sediminis TaxID=2803949 RepID=A0A937JYH8_9BACT|nr:S1/P1 nuclease [Fulvivirga sediminis]MBL3656438.1 S1/P1 nuclease [Fulvivirga sediminis]